MPKNLDLKYYKIEVNDKKKGNQMYPNSYMSNF